MTNLTNDPIMIPIAGEMVEFGRLRPSDLFKVVDYANRCIVKDGMDAFKNASIKDRVEALRQLSDTYSYSDIDELLRNEKYALYVLYRSYVRAHPTATQSEFEEILSDLNDVASVTSSIDRLMFAQDIAENAEDAKSADPPAIVTDSPESSGPA